MQTSARVCVSSLVLSLLLAGEIRPQGGVVQDFGTAPLVGHVSGPAHVSHFVYDAETGVLRSVEEMQPELRVQRSAATTSLCYDNLDPELFMSTHPKTHQELVAWGVKRCGFRGRVTSFTFQYRTILPSVDLSIAFYIGTTGFGNLGTQVRRFAFQGLPPGAPDEVYPGQFANTVTVDLSANPMCLPDGPIGWGFTNDDLVSGSFLNYAPNAQLGTMDALDVYDEPPAKTGVYTGTFNFSSSGFNVASLTIQLEEEDGAGLAGVRLLQGSGVNPLAFTPIGLPILGSLWTANVDLGAAPGATQSTLILAELPAFSPFPTIAGQVLVDLFNPPLLVTSGAATQRFTIPTSAALLDRTFYAQTVLHGGGALKLTNGLALTIGN